MSFLFFIFFSDLPTVGISPTKNGCDFEQMWNQWIQTSNGTLFWMAINWCTPILGGKPYNREHKNYVWICQAASSCDRKDMVLLGESIHKEWDMNNPPSGWQVRVNPVMWPSRTCFRSWSWQRFKFTYLHVCFACILDLNQCWYLYLYMVNPEQIT